MGWFSKATSRGDSERKAQSRGGTIWSRVEVEEKVSVVGVGQGRSPKDEMPIWVSFLDNETMIQQQDPGRMLLISKGF